MADIPGKQLLTDQKGAQFPFPLGKGAGQQTHFIPTVKQLRRITRIFPVPDSPGQGQQGAGYTSTQRQTEHDRRQQSSRRA